MTVQFPLFSGISRRPELTVKPGAKVGPFETIHGLRGPSEVFPASKPKDALNHARSMMSVALKGNTFKSDGSGPENVCNFYLDNLGVMVSDFGKNVNLFARDEDRTGRGIVAITRGNGGYSEAVTYTEVNTKPYRQGGNIVKTRDCQVLAEAQQVLQRLDAVKPNQKNLQVWA
jgi:hypothetical protein